MASANYGDSPGVPAWAIIGGLATVGLLGTVVAVKLIGPQALRTLKTENRADNQLRDDIRRNDNMIRDDERREDRLNTNICKKKIKAFEDLADKRSTEEAKKFPILQRKKRRAELYALYMNQYLKTLPKECA